MSSTYAMAANAGCTRAWKCLGTVPAPSLPGLPVLAPALSPPALAMLYPRSSALRACWQDVMTKSHLSESERFDQGSTFSISCRCAAGSELLQGCWAERLGVRYDSYALSDRSHHCIGHRHLDVQPSACSVHPQKCPHRLQTRGSSSEPLR